MRRVRWGSILALILAACAFGFLASMLLAGEWGCLKNVCLKSYAGKGIVGPGEKSDIVVEVRNQGKERVGFRLLLKPRIEGTVVFEGEAKRESEVGGGEERKYRFKALVNETTEGKYCVDVYLGIGNESVSDEVCLVLKP